MKTQIKEWGHSLVIRLSPDFVKFKDLKVDDWIDLSDIVVIKKNDKNKNKNKTT